MSIWDRVKYVWLNGEVVESKKATVHISSPVVNTGAGVFEGIRAYWQPEKQQLYVFRLKDHIERLFASAKVHRMEISFSKNELKNAVVNLLSENAFKEDIYIRPLVYRGGMWHAKESIDIAIFAAPRPSRLRKPDKGYKCCISSWRRIPDKVMPARVKTCGNYIHGRFARSEARSSGFDEAIFLTMNGKVSEAPGANIFMVRHGILTTPTITSDILEGITRQTILKLAKEDLGVETAEREIDRTELYVAEEIFLCGTGHEIIPVTSVDNLPIGAGKPGKMTEKLRSVFLDVVTGQMSKYYQYVRGIYSRSS